METKKCSKCKRELPVTEFNKSIKSKDGLQSYCKSCQSEAARALSAYKKVTVGGKLPPFSDPDFDGKTKREVMDIMGGGASDGLKREVAPYI